MSDSSLEGPYTWVLKERSSDWLVEGIVTASGENLREVLMGQRSKHRSDAVKICTVARPPPTISDDEFFAARLV